MSSHKASLSTHHLRIMLRLSERKQANREEDLRHQLAGTLVLLQNEGNCGCCGLMLTKKDRDQGKRTYTCPRCGRSGKATPIVAKASLPRDRAIREHPLAERLTDDAEGCDAYDKENQQIR